MSNRILQTARVVANLEWHFEISGDGEEDKVREFTNKLHKAAQQFGGNPEVHFETTIHYTGYDDIDDMIDRLSP